MFYWTIFRPTRALVRGTARIALSQRKVSKAHKPTPSAYTDYPRFMVTVFFLTWLAAAWWMSTILF